MEQLLNKKTIFIDTLETNFERDSTAYETSSSTDVNQTGIIELTRSGTVTPVPITKSDYSSNNVTSEDITCKDSVEKLIDSGDKKLEENREFGESGDLSPPQVLEDTSGELKAIGYPPIASKEVFINQDGVHFFEDGNFWMEVPGLVETDQEDDDLDYPVIIKKKTKLKFSTSPIQVFSTYSVNDYDRRNEDVDPVAASAEYELEKRVEKMDVFPVDLMKGPEGLGLSIIGKMENTN